MDTRESYLMHKVNPKVMSTPKVDKDCEGNETFGNAPKEKTMISDR